MKILLALLTCFLLSAYGYSQVAIPSEGSPKIQRSLFGVGISAGMGSGFGLSFRHHLPGQFSYQIVGGIIKVDRRLHYNLGCELQLDLDRSESTRFFACGATGYFYSGETGHNDLAGPWRTGLGIGGEWSNIRPFNLSAELLFTYFSDGTVLPLPQVAVHYYFF